jgi:hypothetical protein
VPKGLDAERTGGGGWGPTAHLHVRERAAATVALGEATPRKERVAEVGRDCHNIHCILLEIYYGTTGNAEDEE